MNCKTVVCLFLCWLLTFGSISPAQAQDGQTAAPATVFRFAEPPHHHYYERDFKLSVSGEVKDARQSDSDAVINSNPQTPRGFLVKWLEPGQKIAALIEPTEVVMIGGSGEQVRLSLKAGEPVVYDMITLEVLAVVRCGNKVTEGKIRLPERLTVTIEKPVERIVEKPVEVVKYAPCDPNWSSGTIGMYPATPDPKKGYFGNPIRLDAPGLLAMLRIPDAADPILQQKVIALRQFVVARIIQELPEELRPGARGQKKVNGFRVDYNVCTDTLAVQSWGKGWWSWKSFWIGFAVGFGVGFILGHVLKNCPEIGKIFAQGQNPNRLGPLLPQPVITTASGLPGWAIGATVAATAATVAVSIPGVRRNKRGVLVRD